MSSFRHVLSVVVLIALSVPASGAEVQCTEDCVAVGEWQFRVALGAGVRDNPLTGGEDTPLVVLPEVSWYGKRFFLRNLEFGYTFVDRPRHQFSALFTPSYQQAYFNRWDPFNFFESSSGGAGLAATTAVTASAPTYHVAIGAPPAPSGVGSGIAGGAAESEPFSADGVTALVLNRVDIELSSGTTIVTGAADNAITLHVRDAQVSVHGLSPADRLELRGSDVVVSDAAGRGMESESADAGRWTNVRIAEYEPVGPTAVSRGVSADSVTHRKMAGLAGGEYRFTLTDWLEVHAQALIDALDVHNGYETRLAVILPWSVGEHRLALTLGGNYQSRRVLDYYYGVGESDVVEPDERFAVESGGRSHLLRFDWQMPLTSRWSLRGLLKFEELPAEVQASPLVDRSTSAAVFIGGVYHF